MHLGTIECLKITWKNRACSSSQSCRQQGGHQQLSDSESGALRNLCCTLSPGNSLAFLCREQLVKGTEWWNPLNIFLKQKETQTGSIQLDQFPLIPLIALKLSEKLWEVFQPVQNKFLISQVIVGRLELLIFLPGWKAKTAEPLQTETQWLCSGWACGSRSQLFKIFWTEPFCSAHKETVAVTARAPVSLDEWNTFMSFFSA
jgi:hypothetical protein